MTYNVFCTYRLIFSMVGVCFAVCIMAQEGNVSSYRPEWGVFSDYSRFAEAKEFATEFTCTVPIGEYLYLQPVAHVIKTGDRWSSAYCVRVGVQL